jgi:hypothetical protein
MRVLDEFGDRVDENAHADQRDDKLKHATRSLVERRQDQREG